jgi:type II secretory pathway predicted ATPase ExeA
MILVGQPQLKELLRRPELQQFVQRVSAHFFIPALDVAEVDGYITHRLKVVGRDAPIFMPNALRRIAEVSRGIPRSINILCDTALVYGFSAEREKIDIDLVDEVIRDQVEFGVLE